jgi:hypothetical protein
MRVRCKLERLERQLPPPPAPSPEDRRRQRRWARIAGRFIGLVRQAVPLMNDAEQQQMGDAVEACFQEFDGPLRDWVRDLQEGRCRLPDLSGEAMHRLVQNLLHPERGDLMVCNLCGLECARYRDRLMGGGSDSRDRERLVEMARQFGWPQWFDACLGCGGPAQEINWPHLTDGTDHPWKALDGWVGAVRGSDGCEQ